MATISFWVRGDQGGEEILLKVADDVWEAREDAVPIGEIGRFVPGGRIETEWQQAVVPLAAVVGGDGAHLDLVAEGGEAAGEIGDAGAAAGDADAIADEVYQAGVMYSKQLGLLFFPWHKSVSVVSVLSVHEDTGNISPSLQEAGHGYPVDDT